jgi:ribosomal protein L31E
MADKKENIILEREYIVPLRHRWIKKAYYRRTPVAIKELKEFIARHMKVEDRDTRKVKLDKWLNVEMWQRSIRKPLNKVRVKAKKLDNGNVKVELVEIPEYWKFKIEKEKRSLEEGEKIRKEKEAKKKEIEEATKKAEEEAKKEIDKEKQEKDKKTEKEDKKSEEQANIEKAKVEHKEAKHNKANYPKVNQQKHLHRKALEK